MTDSPIGEAERLYLAMSEEILQLQREVRGLKHQVDRLNRHKHDSQGWPIIEVPLREST